MKKIISIITILVFTNTSIFAQPAGATLIIDPQGYTHMIEQIAKAQEYIEKVNEQIKNTEEMKETMGNVRTQLSTAYSNTFGIIGQLNDLVKEFKEIPNSLKSTVKEFLKYTNCLIADVDQLTKIETLQKAKYYRKTPKNSKFNYGTNNIDDENDDGEDFDGDIANDRFGTDELLLFEERPCGLVPTMQKEIEATQQAFNSANHKIQKYTLKYFTEEGAEKFTEKLDKLSKEADKPNQTTAVIQSMSRDILLDIWIELKSMNDLVHLMATYQLENQKPAQLKVKLSQEQLDNIKNLPNEELYKNQNSEKLLDRINSTYTDETIGELPF